MAPCFRFTRIPEHGGWLLCAVGRMTTIFFHIIHLVARRLRTELIWRADSKQRLLGLRRCSMKAAASFLSQIAATKAFLEQKFQLPVECVAQGLGNPRWRDDDHTSNVFGSDARVDTLARRVGIVASRGSTR